MYKINGFNLRLPIVASPMFTVSNPKLVANQCKSGIIGSFPALNARAPESLNDWINQIKEDLEEANKMKSLSEKKLEEYNIILENSKKEVSKILLESKNALNKNIQNKKDSMEKEIENEISKAQKEILQLKKSSIESINNISQEIASNIIEKMSGDKLNESSIKAVVEDISKKNIGKYL